MKKNANRYRPKKKPKKSPTRTERSKKGKSYQAVQLLANNPYTLSMALPIITRPRFPHSQSLPSRSCHKPLILIHQRTDRMKITIIETNLIDHIDHSLVYFNETINHTV